MRVLVFERNLMWSSRLVQSLKALGHEVEVRTDLPEADVQADAAILNLGSPGLPAQTLAPLLKSAGIRVIAHAGHKELELMELGRGLEVDVLATNRELTFDLERLLARASSATEPPK